MIYKAVNKAVYSQIPKSVNRVLDIGCGSGQLGKKIKETIKCEFIGVTYSESEAKLASKYLDQVLIQDINYFDTSDLGIFDCIICSHVLEHLYNPSAFLVKLKKNLSQAGILIVALPNILFWKQRIKFLKGKFRYTDGGLLDKTHYRFFDWDTSLELIQESGYILKYRLADGNIPFPFMRKLFPNYCARLDNIVTNMFPSFFGSQFILVSTKS